MTTPKSKPPDPDTLERTRFYIETEYQNEASLGAIEETQYAIDGDEVLIADLDGGTMGARRLGPNDDPVVVARRLLRERRPKRADKLVFPNVGVA
jgi:hypothetical protein